MDPPFSGFILDPSKCRSMSISEKRELIRELSKWPESAPETLQTWSRRDLMEILCAELGKERKYTSLSKQKIIEHLFKIVSEKKSGEHVEDMGIKLHIRPPTDLPNQQNPSKRQRKPDNPSRLSVATNNGFADTTSEAKGSIRYCLNLACRATVSHEDAFCKRCSCCICSKYDDNKDPSLWLVCSSETASGGNPCGLSCHLECALKHERAGILKNSQCTRLDGSCYCIYCGRVNDLLRCWRKQLMIAKDARRVDVLCYRISLSHKILNFTDKYQGLHEFVDIAMKKLESEVGPLNGLPNMTRGIVNRLSVGAEVQRLCACGIESLDSMLHSSVPADDPIRRPGLMSSSLIKFEGLSQTSVTVVLGLEDHPLLPQELVGFTLWHRKADITEYPTEPTCKLDKADRRMLITDLTPATEYLFKIIAFSNTSVLGNWEVEIKTEAVFKDVKKCSAAEETLLKQHCASPKTNSSDLSNPFSEEYESNNTNACGDLNKLPEGTFDYHGRPEILDINRAYKDTCVSDNVNIGMIGLAEAAEQEGTPGNSGSALDEEPHSTIQAESMSHRDTMNSVENNLTLDLPKSDNESNAAIGNEMVIIQHKISESTDPLTPCRLEIGNEGSGWIGKVKASNNLLENGTLKPEREPGSTSKKRSGEKCNETRNKDGSLEGTYEYCVKVIRWLECEGYIETNFRVKFLTWFSLRATPQERKVVNVYVDTLIDDPASLAGQLVDTFSEAVSCKRPPPVPTGFCMRLWH